MMAAAAEAENVKKRAKQQEQAPVNAGATESVHDEGAEAEEEDEEELLESDPTCET